MNIFKHFPQLIDSDPRTQRTGVNGYNINAEFLHTRYSILLPELMVKDQTILDIGCCVGAAGAWCLSKGAKKYVGVELQTKFAKQAEINLDETVSNSNWQIINASLDEFFAENTEHFDIVISTGTITADLYYQEHLKRLAAVADIIVFDSSQPYYHILEVNPALDWINPIVWYTYSGLMVNEDNYSSFITAAAIPSLKAVSMILEDLGFEIDNKVHQDLQINLPNDYNLHRRYGAVFYNQHQRKRKDIEFVYRNPDQQKTYLWKDTVTSTKIPEQWSFDEQIAEIFETHARQHIPDYDKVINLCKEIAFKHIKDPVNDRILDLGCATGETLKRLSHAGFGNLIGIDPSPAMIAKCDPQYAWFICDNHIADIVPDLHAVLCNWTLHFIKDKIGYLCDIYNHLVPGGFMILTDKTCNTGLELELYHDFKRRQGVTEEEIEAKSKSIKDIMFIDSPSWYLNTLNGLGFADVGIINAAPCFTTFIATKPQ